MEKRIVNNQEILETFWSSNTPNDVMQLLIEGKKAGVTMRKWTSGLIVTRDVKTKEIKLYFGMTELEDEKEDLEFILNYGTKLEGSTLNHLAKIFNPKEQVE